MADAAARPAVAAESAEAGLDPAANGRAVVAVSVRYFAAATEATGRESESIDIAAPATLGALQDALLERYGEPMQRILRSGSFLVGGVVRRDRDAGVSGTVDVLPPFAGG